MFTVLLVIAKYLGMIVTAGLGIYGVAHNYRDGDALNPAGRRAMKLMLCASVLALTATAMEQYRSYVEGQERKVADSLQRPFRDLVLTWPIDSEGAKVFKDALQTAPLSSPAPDKMMINYIGAALRGGTLSVAKGDGGLQLKLELNTPLGYLSREFNENTGEWKAFFTAMQTLIGEYFDLSLTSGARIVELGSSEWPAELNASEGSIEVTLKSPAVSPLEFRSSDFVLTQRGQYRPSEIHITSSDPRVTMDQKLLLGWKKTIWRVTVDKEGETVEQSQFKSGPHKIEMKINKPG